MHCVHQKYIDTVINNTSVNYVVYCAILRWQSINKYTGYKFILPLCSNYFVYTVH